MRSESKALTIRFKSFLAAKNKSSLLKEESEKRKGKQTVKENLSKRGKNKSTCRVRVGRREEEGQARVWCHWERRKRESNQASLS